MDFATLLYQKGLYKQSLKVLEKAKIMALNHEEKYIAYDIVELEKEGIIQRVRGFNGKRALSILESKINNCL